MAVSVAVASVITSYSIHYTKLYEESLETPQEGEVIHGVVIQVLKEYVAVNIHRKSEGMLPLAGLSEEEQASLSPGDLV